MSTSTSNSTLSFHPTCPQDSTFQACGDIFLGCCSTYACTTKGCALGDLAPVAFDASQHGKFPDASCGDGATFWTCTAGPTFWGCCKSNPCATGTCPKDDLVPAFVGNPVQSAYYLDGAGASPAPTGTTTSTSTSTATGAAKEGDGEKSHTGAIAGGAAGGVVGLLLVCWLVYYLLYVRRKEKARREGAARADHETAVGGATTMAEHPGKMGGYYEGGEFPSPFHPVPCIRAYMQICIHTPPSTDGHLYIRKCTYTYIHTNRSHHPSNSPY